MRINCHTEMSICYDHEPQWWARPWRADCATCDDLTLNWFETSIDAVRAVLAHHDEHQEIVCTLTMIAAFELTAPLPLAGN